MLKEARLCEQKSKWELANTRRKKLCMQMILGNWLTCLRIKMGKHVIHTNVLTECLSKALPCDLQLLEIMQFKGTSLALKWEIDGYKVQELPFVHLYKDFHTTCL